MISRAAILFTSSSLLYATFIVRRQDRNALINYFLSTSFVVLSEPYYKLQLYCLIGAALFELSECMDFFLIHELGYHI